jgi:hypothetical protein
MEEIEIWNMNSGSKNPHLPTIGSVIRDSRLRLSGRAELDGSRQHHLAIKEPSASLVRTGYNVPLPLSV